MKKPNGMLPPERELAQMLGVSRPTLRRAMDELITESFIANVPRQGNFLTGLPPSLSVGMVIPGATLVNTEIAPALISKLNGYRMAFFHTDSLRNLASLYKDNGLAGMVMLDPRRKDCNLCAELLDAKSISAIAMVPFANFGDSGFPLKHSFICMDKTESGRVRAELFLRRGRRSIAYIGEKDVSYQVFKRRLADSGVAHGSELCIEEMNAGPKLLKLLDSWRIDAIASNGCNIRINSVLNALASHPRRSEVELEMPNLPEFKALLRKVPDLKIAGLLDVPYSEIGKAAAEMLLAKMAGEKTPAPICVRPSMLESVHAKLFMEAMPCAGKTA